MICQNGARHHLFELVRTMWKEESLPEGMVRGVPVPTFKGKGGKSDMAKYRFTCLLNHSYKLLSTLRTACSC